MLVPMLLVAVGIVSLLLYLRRVSGLQSSGVTMPREPRLRRGRRHRGAPNHHKNVGQFSEAAGEGARVSADTLLVPGS